LDSIGGDFSRRLPTAVRRWFRLFWARRWLLIAVAAVLIIFIAAGGLSFRLAVLGFVAIALSAAYLPRQSIWRSPSAASTPTGGSDITGRAYKAVVEALPDPALILDASGSVLFLNRHAGELFSAAEIGQHLSSLTRNPDLLDAVSQALKHIGPVSVTYSERVPVERRMAASIAALRDPSADRAQSAILVSFRDLTEQERLNQMRADFIANASHELRTPLASVLGFIETLQGPARDDAEATDRFLTIMAEQAGRMSRLIDDLLSLSRIEMKAHLVPEDVVDVNQTVSYVAAALVPLAKENNIDLAVAELPGGARVRGDRDELVQVFQNVIQNGLKYGRQGGAVSVTIARRPPVQGQAGSIAISVTDDGPGIDPEHLPRITERFYRVDLATSRETGGTGLGLAIVKNVINRHRGDLEIVSTPGEGSTFTVLLPEYSESV